MDWISVMTNRINEIKPLENNIIYTERFIRCFHNEHSKIYNILFNDSYISTKMCDDINVSFEKLGHYYDKYQINNIDELIQHEIKEKNNYIWVIQNNKNCASVGLLWLYRAMHFCYTFIEYLSWNELNTVNCAKETYRVTLAPYHSWPLKILSRTAIALTPSRSNILNKLQLPVDKQFTIMEKYIEAMHPILEKMREIIDTRNINFDNQI